MNTVIHLLGADIAHHNHTVLKFFQQYLLTRLSAEQSYQFMVVGNAAQWQQYASAQCQIRCFTDQKQFAKAVIQQAKLDKQCQFFLHGQFNLWIWLAILVGLLPGKRCYWHVWGADLYQQSSRWQFRLFYPIRRIAQRKIGHLLATRGDLSYFRQYIGQTAEHLLYFPTPVFMPSSPVTDNGHQTEPLRILLGNSGDRSNCHQQGLKSIAQQWGTQVKVLLPMGYPTNNENYIEQVRQTAIQLGFAEQVVCITEKMVFADYLQLIQQCYLGYFIFPRQQGIGTLCLLIAYNIPMVLDKRNPFIIDLREQQIPFLLVDEAITQESIMQVKQQLMALNKEDIAFFPSQYRQGWLQALALVEERHDD